MFKYIYTNNFTTLFNLKTYLRGYCVNTYRSPSLILRCHTNSMYIIHSLLNKYLLSKYCA